MIRSKYKKYLKKWMLCFQTNESNYMPGIDLSKSIDVDEFKKVLTHIFPGVKSFSLDEVLADNWNKDTIVFKISPTNDTKE